MKSFITALSLFTVVATAHVANANSSIDLDPKLYPVREVSCSYGQEATQAPIHGYSLSIFSDIEGINRLSMRYPNCMVCMVMPSYSLVTSHYVESGGMTTVYEMADLRIDIGTGYAPIKPTNEFPAVFTNTKGVRYNGTCTLHK